MTDKIFGENIRYNSVKGCHKVSKIAKFACEMFYHVMNKTRQILYSFVLCMEKYGQYLPTSTHNYTTHANSTGLFFSHFTTVYILKLNYEILPILRMIFNGNKIIFQFQFLFQILPICNPSDKP